MTSRVDRMLGQLAPDIERKCEQLRAARRQRLQARIFILLCIAAVLLPTLLVVAGVSLTVLLAPLIFMSLSIVLLLPVLLADKHQGGIRYEQA